jgi:hypothetical protein
MFARAARISPASFPLVSYSDLFSAFSAFSMTDYSNLVFLTKIALTIPQKIPKTELPIIKA